MIIMQTPLSLRKNFAWTLCVCETMPMEIVTDINRWWLSPMHRLLGSVECRSLHWHKVLELCLSKPMRSRRRLSSLDVRLHLPMYCVKHFRVFRNIVESICQIVFGKESLTVVRKLSVLYALANPFIKSVKVCWS